MTSGARRVFIETVDGDRALALQIARAVEARGLSVSHRLDESVALVLRTPGAEALRSMLGDTHTFKSPVRVVDRAEAVATIDLSELMGIAEESADDGASLPWSAALATLTASSDEAECYALLADGRCAGARERRLIVDRLASIGSVLALDLLCESLRGHCGALGAEEATALGRAWARGASRWKIDSPFAIELDDPREELASTELALFKNAGEYSRLCDERGVTVHRAIIEAIPWIDSEDGTSSALALLRSMESHASGRVWIRGWVLPSAMPWTIWTALLGQRARR